MSTPRLRVVIVGAGIGGLAAGVMLRSFANVTILESAHQLKNIGAAVTIGPGAISILRRFGVNLDQEGGVTVDGFQLCDSDGNVVANTPFRAKERLGEDPISVHRADMHSALLRAATAEDGPDAPCNILINHKVVGMDVSAGFVTTSDGASFLGDVIVCADGVHSCSRTFVLEEKVEAEPSGESAYRFLIRHEDLQAVDHPILVNGYIPSNLNMVKGQARKLLAYPIRGGKLLNVVAYIPDSSLTESISDKWTSKSSVESLLQAHEHFSPLWKSMLATAKDVSIWQIRDIPQLRTWINGRAILIGDAAHAMLPHRGAGAMSAIEDAEALAVVLRDATSATVPGALARAFAMRYKRAIAFQAASRAQGLHAPPDPHDGEKLLAAWAYSGAERWAAENPDMVLPV